MTAGTLNLNNYESCIITSGVSDHFPIVFFLQAAKPHVPKKAVYSRDFSEPNLLKFEQSLHSLRWGFVLEEEDPQAAYNLFSDSFFNLYNLHFPLREIKFNKNFHIKEPWMSKGLLVSRKEKIRLASCAAKNPTHFLKSKYKIYRNIYNSLLRAGKKLYYERELGKNVSNLKKTWELIKKATNTSNSASDPLSKLIYNGESFSDSYQIACKLNEFFTSMPLKIANEIPPCEDDIPEPVDTGSSSDDNIPLLNFSNCPVTETEILDAISMLLPKKTEDFNGVSLFFLKKFKNYLVKPLRHIFNCSFMSSIVPSQFKIAKVIPLFKSGDKSLPDNYRPISLLSCFSKIFEKVVCLRLLNFLENNNILTPDQFGFRKSHSAVHPMVHMMNFVSRALNKKETTIAIFCDLRKAFDTVNHEILLKKMHKMGIRGNELDWFKNYLSNRKQFVYLNGKSSSLLEILLGVPQGSILGPILFLIYINDLPLSSLLKSLLFADDTALLASGSNIDDLVEFVNNEFHKVVYYFRKNRLSLHPEKTKFMVFSNSLAAKKEPPKIFANYNNFSGPQNVDLLYPIENVTSNSSVPAIRYLGVYFDPQLNFKYHISTIVNKISKMLYFYRQAKNVLTFKAKRYLYFSSIHSHLIFAIQIWSCTTETSLNPLIIKQKMAIRILNDATYNSHTEPLFKSCGILPLKYLCEYFKVQFMQKFTQGFLPSSFDDVWISNKIRRAGQDQVELRNNDDINIPFARLCSTQRQPLSGFPKIWASFPDERIKFIRNVVEFNSELKMYYLNLLSAKPNCTRLLCPHCHLPKNTENSLNLSVDLNVHL
jgi:hypothetical protein